MDVRRGEIPAVRELAPEEIRQGLFHPLVGRDVGELNGAYPAVKTAGRGKLGIDFGNHSFAPSFFPLRLFQVALCDRKKSCRTDCSGGTVVPFPAAGHRETAAPVICAAGNQMVNGAAFPRQRAVGEVFPHLGIPRSPEERRFGVQPDETLAPLGDVSENVHAGVSEIRAGVPQDDDGRLS